MTRKECTENYSTLERKEITAQYCFGGKEGVKNVRKDTENMDGVLRREEQYFFSFKVFVL